MSEGKKTVTVWILGDQLLEDHPALAQARDNYQVQQIRIVLVESQSRFQRHRYHRKKVILLKSAMRHYARWLESAGYKVDYRQAQDTKSGLEAHIKQYQPSEIITMQASEYAGRLWQETHMQNKFGIPVNVIPNTQFLLGQYNPIPDPETDKRYVMEQFYRKMRHQFDVLLDENGEPEGGEWNYDKQNRKPYPAEEQAPRRLRFLPDDITQSVIEEIENQDGFGEIDGFDLAVTHQQAEQALEDFIQNRLIHFGIYEDAMTERDEQLYHSVLSPYLNIGLLTPLQIIRKAEQAYYSEKAPINSVEGLIRQILGWREFMYWQYWRQMPEITELNAWSAEQSLPEFFWTGDTDMNCLKHVFERIQANGYVHHIERLMLLSNFCTLTGIQPMQVNDWFLSTFIDAYEWVMIPNVLGMGLNADGGLTATKPYISSANYINKMSDYCGGCHFSHKHRTGENACPFNFLYWNFLIQNEETLRSNARFGPAVLGLRHLDDIERQEVQKQAHTFIGMISDTSKA